MSASAIRSLARAAVVAGVVGCGASTSGTSTGDSPCVSASSCPEGAAPSYKASVAAIFEKDCVSCHSPSGTAGFDMTTYARVSAEAGSILSQVSVCQMPPLNGPTMTDEDRTTMTAWLRCGAPDN